MSGPTRCTLLAIEQSKRAESFLPGKRVSPAEDDVRVIRQNSVRSRVLNQPLQQLIVGAGELRQSIVTDRPDVNLHGIRIPKGTREHRMWICSVRDTTDDTVD